jgi:hypothetical protein
VLTGTRSEVPNRACARLNDVNLKVSAIESEYTARDGFMPTSVVGRRSERVPPGGVSSLNQKYAASAPERSGQGGSPGGAAALQDGTMAYPSVYPFHVFAVRVATHIDACFARRFRLSIAIGDPVVRAIDRVDP